MSGAAGAPVRSTMAVVVVNYGSSQLLARHLAELDLTGHDARVVVVDNHSGDAELAAVGALAARHGWELVPMADNAGFGRGMNAGMDRAARLGCTSFLLLNPDATITAEVVEALHSHVERFPLDLVAAPGRGPGGGRRGGGARGPPTPSGWDRCWTARPDGSAGCVHRYRDPTARSTSRGWTRPDACGGGWAGRA